MNTTVVSIRENYLRVLVQIADATRRSGRDPEQVRLVVVTKTQPLETVQAAIEAGVRTLGAPDGPPPSATRVGRAARSGPVPGAR